MSIGTAVIDIVGNMSGFGRDVEAGIDRTGRRLTTIGAGLTAAITGPLISMGTTAVQQAQDMWESINAVEVVFGDAAQSVLDFGQTSSTQLGLSRQALNELVVPMGALLQNAGFAADEAAEASLRLTERASDMASVFNTDVSEALEAIQSGLRGEANPLERFGVGLSAAAVNAYALRSGLAETAGEIDDNIRAQARLGLLMEQTEAIAGDFARTSLEGANAQRIAEAQAADLAAEFGGHLLPIKNQLVGMLNQLLGAFSNLSPEMQSTIVTVAAVAAVLGPLLIGIGSVVRVIGLIGPAITAVIPIIKGLWALLLANPIGLVIAAVVAIAFVIYKYWDEISAFFVKVWDKITAVFAEAWATIKEAFRLALGTMLHWLSGWGLPGLIIKHWDRIKGFVVGAVTAVRDFVVNGFQALRDAAVGRLAELMEWVQGTPLRILAALGNLGLLLIEKGKDLIRGLWDGIKAMGSWLKDKIVGWFAGLLPGWVKDALGIRSPSTVFAGFGEDAVAGFVVGMEDRMGSLRAAVAGLGSVGGPQFAFGGAGGMSVGSVNVSVVVDTAGGPVDGRRVGAEVGDAVLEKLARYRWGR